MSAPLPGALADEPARQAARERLDESLLVEAGAGTGKTSLIVDRVANLVESGVAIERIVAITFTEKAAGELKLRIRRALENRASQGSRRARVALSALERASISTIHAFCARLLREHPVESGVDPLFRVLDASGTSQLFDETWERWLARELSGDGANLPIARIALFTPDEWVRELKDLAKHLVRHRAELPGAIPAAAAAGGASPERGAAGGASPERGAPSVEAALASVDAAALSAPCKVPAEDDMALALASLARLRASFAAASPRARDEMLLRHEIPVKGHKSWSRVGNAGRWRSKESLAAARDAANGVQVAWVAARAGLAHDLCVSVARWLSEGFVREYEAEKTRRGVLDFDDLLVRTRDLLASHPAVRRRARRGMRLILDEFQDTDPIQCEMAFLLASELVTPRWQDATPAPGALFLVGDPKQAIYGFRGADVESYSTVRALFDGAARVREISTNFRSREAVLGWVNAVFAKLLVAGDGDAARWQIGYRPLDVHHTANGEGSGVHLVRPPDGTAYESVGAGRDEESRAVAALLRDHAHGRWTVRDPRGDRPARWGDMVVLLRNRKSSLPAFERAFRAAGIPWVVVGGRALWARAEVRALTALCQAIENPFDGVAVVAALKSAFFGASDADLLLHRHRHGSLVPRRDSAGGLVGAALACIARWHHDRLLLPPATVLEDVLAETGAIASFGLKPDGAQRVANLLRLLDAARAGEPDPSGARAAGRPLSFRGFVDRLSERASDLREEAEGAILEDEDDAVRVLTLHAAKGLEFPIVVLGDLSRRETPPGGELYDPATRTLAFRLSGASVTLETANFETATETSKARAKAEDGRLFYVGATRAKDALVVPLFPSHKGDSLFKTLATDHPAMLAAPAGATVPAGDGGPARMWVAGQNLTPITGDSPVLRVPIDALEAALTVPPAGPRDDSDERALSRNIASRMQGREVRSVTGILRAEASAPAAARRPDTGLNPDESARLGVAVHAALEHGHLADPDDLEKGARLQARALLLPHTAVERAGRLARAAATLPAVARARASDRSWREWSFVLPVVGGGGGAEPAGGASLLEGIVDFAWIEDGELVILDWKTDALPPGDEGAIAAAVEHHTAQLMVYALAASTITGLPVRSVVLALLDAGRAVETPVTPAHLSRARARLASGFEPASKLLISQR